MLNLIMEHSGYCFSNENLKLELKMDAYILSTVLDVVRAKNVMKVILKHNNLLDIHYDHFR